MPKTKRMIGFTEPQLAYLTREAARLGISVPELNRRIVDQYRGVNEQRPAPRYPLEPAVIAALDSYEAEIGEVMVAAVTAGGPDLQNETRGGLAVAQRFIEQARRGDPMLTPGFAAEIQRLLERAKQRIAAHETRKEP